MLEKNSRPKQANPPSGRNPTQPGKIKRQIRKGPSLDLIIFVGHLSVGLTALIPTPSSFPGTAVFSSHQRQLPYSIEWWLVDTHTEHLSQGFSEQISNKLQVVLIAIPISASYELETSRKI